MSLVVERVCEEVGGERYAYLPLGRHVVRADGVCGGEPTFKYTRIRVRHAVDLISAGRTIPDVSTTYGLPVEALQEAIDLAVRALIQSG